MANIKSAIKRVEIAERNEFRNKAVKSRIKTEIKKFDRAVENADKEEAKKYLDIVEKHLRQAETKNIIHKNNISRKISQLTKKYNSLAN